MVPLKCMYCKKMTTIHKINAQKKINGKIITLTNTPVYYCKLCDETFLSKEAMDAFSHIQTMGLDKTKILFEFEAVFLQLEKNDPDL